MSKHLIILLSIFILGYFLRVMFLPLGGLTFSYDQGRDAFNVSQILSGDIKIQGPPASTPGLFHGVLYYYLLLPGYFFGHGSPIVAGFFYAFFNSLGIIITYLLAYYLFKNQFISGLLSLFYATSFEQTQYATWLSNPSFAVVAVPLIYLGVLSWINGKKLGPIISGLGLGLAVQADIFLLYHVLPVSILLFQYRKNIKIFQLLTFLIVFGIFTSSMIVSQVKFGLTGIVGIRQLLLSPTSTNSYSPLKKIEIFSGQFGRLFSFNLGIIDSRLALIISLTLIFWTFSQKKNKLVRDVILFSLFSFAFGSFFGGSGSAFIAVGLGTSVYLLFGFLFSRLPKLPVIALSFLIVVLNIKTVLNKNPNGQTFLALQPSLNLKNELAAMDYIYQIQAGQPFSLNTITAPLYINTAWSYLFNWYGLNHYGYLPYWHGHKQVNLLGNNLSSPSPQVLDYYLIIDPPEPNFAKFIEPGIREENGKTYLISEIKYGDIRVQKRYSLKETTK